MSARCRDQAPRGARVVPRRRDFARVARTILREPSTNLVRIVAARPPSASGRTTTIPFPPDPFPLSVLPHGRTGGGTTLLWPGGPFASPGHGGRGLVARPETGDGLDVGRGVAWAVGFGVGCAVGRGVATTGGRPAFVEPGVGVGTTATIGPSVGGVEAGGSVDGSGEDSIEGSTDDPTAGATEGEGSVPPLLDGVGSAEADGVTAAPDGPGLAPMAAIPSSRCGGATNPVVNATVARMRFRSPMATTRRAR
jgi:hypothetical protein